MDQGGAEGFSGVSRKCAIPFSNGAHDCSRGWQSGHRETHARPRFGVFEIALAFRGDAFRVVYAVQLADDIWVIHAFQKKSKQGIKTPKHEIDLVKTRLKSLKEVLR